MSELEWAVQAAGMEAVVQALVVEAVEVWPGLESLKTQNHKDLRRPFDSHNAITALLRVVLKLNWLF